MHAQVLAQSFDVTERPEFGRWFRQSKVVDSTGRPLVVYHGTSIEKDRFMRGGGCAGVCAYFTANQAEASMYAEDDASIDGGTAITMAVYLSLQNPFVTTYAFDRTNYDRHADPQAVTEQFRDRLEAEGFDGIHIQNTGEWVAFRPEQIKSVDNGGAFDPSDPRIAFKRAQAGDVELDDEEARCTPRF